MSYFLYALIAIAILAGGILLELSVMGRGNMKNLLPSEMVTEDGTLTDASMLYELGGYAERLDRSHRVVQTYGEGGEKKNSYTLEELLSLNAWTQNEDPYEHFYEPVSDGGVLIHIPKDRMSVQFNYTLQGEPRWILIATLFLLILEGVWMSRIFYRKIKSPLTELTSAMQAMQDGNRDLKLDFRAEGEFIILRDAFNRMIGTLRTREEENKELKSAQQRMILELSHDIRNPIATIVACATALDEGVVSEKELKSYYATISSKANRVSRMADDMFTMFKTENTDYELTLETIDLTEFLRRMGADFYNDALQKDLEMRVDLPDEAVPVRVDKTLLYRAIGNLLSNAIRYNETGRSVSVAMHADEKNDFVTIHITDDGKRIDPAFVERMFEPFSRSDKARKTDGGTGLGLTIAKSILEKHDATIEYRYADGANDMTVTMKRNENPND